MTRARDLADPKRIGRYQVQGILGQGATGTVYACTRDDGRRFAVKLGREGQPGPLNTEFAALKHLSQRSVPGVVRLHEIGSEEGRPWYAMDLVEGPTLRDVWRQVWEPPRSLADELTQQTCEIAASSMAPRNVADEIAAPMVAIAVPAEPSSARTLAVLALRVAETLCHLHGSGIVHGDLKPENIVIGGSDEPVLVDFGAAAEGYGDTLSQSSLVRGGPWLSPGYAAPEVMLGEPPSARSDLFSFGTLLFELLTGRLPARGWAQTYSGRLGEPGPPWPASTSALATPPLRTLVTELLAADPADRPGFAIDVVQALSRELGVGCSDDAEGSALAAALHRPRLVGRVEELRRVSAALTAVRDRASGIVFIEGEEGIGKTRLLTEALREVDTEAVALVAASHERPVGSAERSTGIIEPLTRVIREEASRRPAPPFAEALLARQSPDTTTDEPGSAERAVNELLRSLAWLAEVRPTVLVLDEVDVADDPTLELAAALQRKALSRVLVVACSASPSSDTRVAALRNGASLHLVLNRLGEDGIRLLLRDVLASQQLPATLVTRVSELSAGNPLFALECARAAVDGRLIRRQQGHWQMAASTPSNPESASLPASMQELLRLRCSRLSLPARRMLELAALLGAQGPIPRLIDLTRDTWGADVPDTSSALGDLLRSGLLKRSGPSGYELEHPLLGDFLRSTIAGPERTRLHGVVAEYLTRCARPEDTDDTFDEALGYNLAEAGRHEEASRHLAAAADRHAREFNLRRAARLYQYALIGCSGLDELRPQLQDARAPIPPELDTAERLGDARVRLGHFEEAAATYDRLVSSTSEPLRRARALRKRAYALTSEHRHEEAETAYAAAVEALPGTSTSSQEEIRERIEIGLCRFENAYFLRNTERMQQLLDHLGPLVQNGGNTSQQAKFSLSAANASFLSAGYSYMSDAEAWCLQAVALLDREPDLLPVAAFARVELGMMLLFGGTNEWSRAVDHLRRGALDLDRISDLKLLARARTYLSTALRRLKRVDEAAREARNAIDVAEICQLEPYIAVGWANLAWVSLVKGDETHVLKLGERALSMWRNPGPVYPMQWLAAFPLLSVRGARGEREAVRSLAELLLSATQQRLPNELRSALRCLADAESDIESSQAARTVTRIAGKLGYV